MGRNQRTRHQMSRDLEEQRRLEPYDGQKTELLVAIDIGTTFSAASFCLLKPRASPSLEDVQNWPGQNQPEPKIPSVIYYDLEGNPQIWGAQTLKDEFVAQAEENDWIKVEWFKLALRPTSSPLGGKLSFPIRHSVSSVPALPVFLPVEKVYKDFLRLILGHIKTDFCRRHASGDEIWDECFPRMRFVLSIPSGWEVKQQTQIRNAAIAAGFIGIDNNATSSEQQAMSRIRFVSEAEAAIIFAAQSGRIDPWLQVDEEIILCDVGGGTIDITAYTIKDTDPLILREKAASQCIVAGAVFVNQEAQNYFSERVRGSSWDTQERVEYLMSAFENGIKKTLDGVGSKLSVGRKRGNENIPTAGIRNGRFYLPGSKAASFFEKPLNAIKEGIRCVPKREDSTKKVVMVGGLMNNSYVFRQLEAWGLKQNVQFSKPDGHMAKCVSHGALLYELLRPVTSYVSRFHYGTDISLPVAECEGDTSGRKTSLRSDGVHVVPDIWHTIVKMDSCLEPDKPIVSEYDKVVSKEEIEKNPTCHEKIFICRTKTIPRFTTTVGLEESSENSIEQCYSVVVDLKSIFDDMPFARTPNGAGKKYKVLQFDICIVFDGMNVKAYAKWSAKGKTRRGEAMVLPASA